MLGESFAVVDLSGAWAWGYSLHDGYVGYLDTAALGAFVPPTHIVSSPAALLFADRSIKSPVVDRLPMGARLVATGEDDSFVQTASGFVHRRHLVPIGLVEPDYVEVAGRLAGVPYLWGGRSGNGIDCSGLVQLALGFAGIACPRDSDQQRTLGSAVPDGEPLQRGDLVFLPGHVGIMANPIHLLHANAFWMSVVSEPLADVLARQPGGEGVMAARRLT